MALLLMRVRALVRRRCAGVACVSAAALLCVLGVSTWRPHAQNQGERQQNAVRILDLKEQRPRVDPTDRGATYHWLEGRAGRTTTRFADAIAVTERIAGGDLNTRLTDMAGNELATLTVDRVESATDVVEFRTGDDNRLRAAGRPGLRPTLDWGNRQAYALWKDKPAGPETVLEWRDDLMRARRSPLEDGGGEMTEVLTEWPDGFAAVASKATGARRHAVTGAPVRGTTVASQLTKDNMTVGGSRWYPEEQVFVWSVPGLTKGYLDAERLKELGGWTFTPDLPWANLQSYAFHYFHHLVATQGFVAQGETRRGGWIDTILSGIAPTVLANEPGCDGLHWLDGTIFRPCCDQHDRCYEKYGCSYKSWWQWWSSWRCDTCNLGAAMCFSGTWPPYQQSFP